MASLRKRSGKWWFTITDAAGNRVERKGTTDKRVTAELASAAEAEVARVRAGLIDPKAARLAAEARRPLAEHIAEWEATLRARGRTPDHAALSANRVRALAAVAAGLPWPSAVAPPRSTRAAKGATAARVAERLASARLSTLDGVKVQAALAGLASAGRSLQSANHYRAAARAFCAWAVATGRLRESPMAGVAGYNVADDPRHPRRALSAGELARLIASAEAGAEAGGVPGRDRAIAYRLAAGTGFRANELRALTPESFRLDDPPSITLPAVAAKNGRKVAQPIGADLAAALRPWLATKPPGSPVLAIPERSAEMIRADLEAAGVPYRTAEGFADFHALRHTYNSAVDRAGGSMAVKLALARVSSPVVLARYSHGADAEKRQAVAAMATLIHDPDQRIRNEFAVPLPCAGDVSWPAVTDAGAFTVTLVHPTPDRNPRPVADFGVSRRVASGLDGVRPAGFEPATDGLENRCSIH